MKINAPLSLKIFSFKIIGAFLSLATTLVLSHGFDKGYVGKYGLCLTLVAFFSLAVGLGQNVNLMKAGSAAKSHLDEASKYVCFILLITTLSLMAPFYLVVSSIFEGAALFFLGLLFVYFLSAVKVPLLTLNKKFMLNSFFDDMLRPFWGLLFVTAAFLLREFFLNSENSESAFEISSILLAIFIAPVIVYLLFLIASPAFGNAGAVQRKETGEASLWDYVKSGGPATVIGVLTLLISQFDRIYIPWLTSQEMLGVYFIAQTALLPISYFTQSVVVKATPKLVRMYSSECWEEMQITARNQAGKCVLFVFVFVFFVLISRDILAKIFGVTTHADVFILVIIVISLAHLISLAFGFGATLMLYSDHGDRRRLILYLAISFSFGSVVGGVLAYLFGIVGAAVGTGCGMVLNRALPYINFRRKGVNLGLV